MTDEQAPKIDRSRGTAIVFRDGRRVLVRVPPEVVEIIVHSARSVGKRLKFRRMDGTMELLDASAVKRIEPYEPRQRISLARTLKRRQDG